MEDFEIVHVLGHHADIPLTEFIYRTEVGLFCVLVVGVQNSMGNVLWFQTATVSNYKQWAQACEVNAPRFAIMGASVDDMEGSSGIILLVILLTLFVVAKLARKAPVARQHDKKSSSDSHHPVSSRLPSQ